MCIQGDLPSLMMFHSSGLPLLAPRSPALRPHLGREARKRRVNSFWRYGNWRTENGHIHTSSQKRQKTEKTPALLLSPHFSRRREAQERCCPGRGPHPPPPWATCPRLSFTRGPMCRPVTDLQVDREGPSVSPKKPPF